MKHEEPMKRRYSVRDAIGDYFGLDFEDVPWYRYQPSRTPCPIYHQDEDYYTASGPGKKPRSGMGYEWVEVPGALMGASHGWRIWKSKREENEL